MAAIANQRWISFRNIIIYLETQFRTNRWIFVFWWTFWTQNGRHSKPKMDINSQHQNLLGNQISSKWRIFVFWSPYGAACFPSCKYPFPLKSFHFWIFNDFLNFYIGGHFENSKTWMHLLRWGSTLLWSLVKIGSSVSENLVGQNRSERKWRKNNNN